MGFQNIMDRLLRRFVIDKEGVLVHYKGKAKHVVIPDRVTAIGTGAFERNSTLESVTIPQNVHVIMEKAFLRCSRLSRLRLTKGLYSIESKAFSYCPIEELTLPAGCQFIGDSTFAGCSRMVSLTLSSGLQSIDAYAFKDCRELKDVIIPDSVSHLGIGVFKGCTVLRSAVLPKGESALPEELFCECSHLRDVHIPDSVAYIRKNAFLECHSLESIQLPSHLMEIGDAAFQHCISLQTISIPDSVCLMGMGVFSRCDVLRSAKLSCTPIRESMFESCPNLCEVHMPDGIRSIEDYAFRSCGKLTNISIPATVKEFGTDCFGMTPFFQKCPGELVIMGDGVLLSYRGHAKKLELPPEVKSIHEQAFMDDQPKVLVIHETVERLRWKFIPGLILIFCRKGYHVDITLYDKYTHLGQDEKRIISFWENKHIIRRHRMFYEIHDPVYKFPLSVLMFLSEPEDPFFAEYVKRNARDILKNLIIRNDVENLEHFLSLGFVNADNIDELIAYAISHAQENGNMEPQLVLMDYKREHIGYSDISSIIGNAFDL